MTVREIMTAGAFFVKDDASVSDAVDIMKKNEIGMVPVCDNRGCILGVVTDRDVLMRWDPVDGASFSTEPVSKIMTSDIVSVSPEMNIHDAACIFSENRKRRLPVVENSRLIGILSLSDLAKKRVFLAEVGEIMGSLVSR